MHRRSALLVLALVLGLIAAACGGSADDPTTTSGDTPSSTAAPGEDSSGGTEAPGEPEEGGSDDGSTPSVTLPPGGTIEGPMAPDFTIALGEDGSEAFTLSQGATPVYMVFWAEW